MRNDVETMIPCVRRMMTERYIISDEMAGESLVRETMMVRSRLLEIPRNSTGIFEDGIEGGQEREGECRQQLSRNNSLSVWLYFLETVSTRVEYKE